MRNIFKVIILIKRFLLLVALITPSFSWADNLFGIKLGTNVIDHFSFSEVFKESDVFFEQNELGYFVADVTDLLNKGEKSSYFNQYRIVYDAAATIHQVAAFKGYDNKETCSALGEYFVTALGVNLKSKLSKQGKFYFPDRVLYFTYDNSNDDKPFAAGVYCNNYFDTGPEMAMFVSSPKLQQVISEYYDKF